MDNDQENQGSGRQLKVRVWRGKQGSGSFQLFSLPRRENQTVLDVVTHIQRNLDPTLAYRFACRVGMCGSCAMMVNGRPRWTCRSHVDKVVEGDELVLEPLRNLPHIRDLVSDMAPFFDKWQAAGGRFQPGPAAEARLAEISPADPARQDVDAGIECIGCGVCYAACDLVTWRDDYLGPAALNRAWTLVRDSRDKADAQRLRSVMEGGCQNCHSMSNCAAHCPKGLNPTASIAGLKGEITRSLLRGRL